MIWIESLARLISVAKQISELWTNSEHIDEKFIHFSCSMYYSLQSFLCRGTRISVHHDDIVDQETEAIVNAANSSLMGGGGVDGAIHSAGGPEILQQCLAIRKKDWPGGLPTGKAVLTTGGNLRAKYVIHTVGPVWRGGSRGEKENLACYENSLRLAASNSLQSISFPAISTGAYGYPIELASSVALNSIKEELNRIGNRGLKEIRFVLFTVGDYESYLHVARSVFQE